ncbi:MAG: hypothetical protein K1563_14950, partial [Candidatus Thiodiazotropha sp. (ex. Lucinisca nassula)]|nr:hypothetical protein [Candidatus Thiodiazotropha sp. (ex. Lucinisca nassula)]
YAGERMQLIAGCVLSACVFACDAADLIESTSKGWKAFANKPFSAVLVEYRRDSADVYSKSRIYLSPMGMRTERLSVQNGEPDLIVIKNHHTEQVWLINPVQHYFTELPIDKTKETERVIEGEKRPLLGVLANEPCYGMRAEKQSVRAVGDSELSIWHCLDGDGKQHLQHFSTLLGVVIRQEFQDGRISELQDIAFIDDSGKYFQPSSDMQQISIGELITGRVTLPDFVE